MRSPLDTFCVVFFFITNGALNEVCDYLFGEVRDYLLIFFVLYFILNRALDQSRGTCHATQSRTTSHAEQGHQSRHTRGGHQSRNAWQEYHSHRAGAPFTQRRAGAPVTQSRDTSHAEQRQQSRNAERGHQTRNAEQGHQSFLNPLHLTSDLLNYPNGFETVQNHF